MIIPWNTKIHKKYISTSASGRGLLLVLQESLEFFTIGELFGGNELEIFSLRERHLRVLIMNLP